MIKEKACRFSLQKFFRKAKQCPKKANFPSEKYLIFISTFFFLVMCITKSTGNKRQSITTAHSLIPFNVVYYDGDDGIEKYEINIYKKEDKFYADNISPYTYYGRKTDSIWTVELDSIKIAACRKFLVTAKSQLAPCVNDYSGIHEFTIKFKTDIPTIKRNHPCPCEDFFDFREALFKEKFEENVLRIKNIKYELSKKLAGRWYMQRYQKKLQENDFIILTKNNESNSLCYWEFGVENYFKSNCNQIVDFTYYNEFIILPFWRDISIQISYAPKEDNDARNNIPSQSARLRFDSVNNNYLRVQLIRPY